MVLKLVVELVNLKVDYLVDHLDGRKADSKDGMKVAWMVG